MPKRTEVHATATAGDPRRAMTDRPSCEFSPANGFRPDDLLAFHGRDAAGVAERVGERSLRKGLMWRGLPASLSLEFRSGRAHAQLCVDGAATHDDQARFEAMARRMLGLTQPVEEFEARFRDHPRVGALIASRPGLRVPVTATPFEALTWAVTGQQISVAAALSLRRRLIVAADVRHSDGLLCHPDAPRIASLGAAKLRDAGFSRTKIDALLALSLLVNEQRLPLDSWAEDPPIEQIRERLQAVRGVGPWTVSYTLLRGFGWLDGSLHGDVAVRRALQTLLGSSRKISEAEAKEWLADFSPWRALVAAHLWALQSIAA